MQKDEGLASRGPRRDLDALPIAILNRGSTTTVLVASILRNSRIPSRLVMDIHELIEAADDVRPECVLLCTEQLAPPDLTLLHQLTNGPLPTACIVVAASSEVSLAIAALRTGAFDVLLGPSIANDLLLAIPAAVLAGRSARAASKAREMVLTLLTTLTSREREVLDSVVMGLANKAIASRLDLREKTVEVHRAHALKKMRTKSLPDLVRQMILIERHPPALTRHSTSAVSPPARNDDRVP